MRFVLDDRAQAIQVGAVLALGIAVLGLTLAQTQVIPEENKRVEFQHSLSVQSDLIELRSALIKSGTTGDVQPVTIDMGTTYPPRIVFINPPPPSGVLRNGSEQTIRVTDVKATSNETDDFLNASENGPYTLETTNLSYTPNYNEYQQPPTTSYQMGVVVNEFENGNQRALTDQIVVKGNRIYFVSLTGNISRGATRTVAVDPRTLSVSSAATTVRNTSGSGENITLTVPTTLTAPQYRELLADQYDENRDPGTDDAYVYQVTNATGQAAVNLTLEGGVTYRLRTARVAVGTGGKPPAPAYLTTTTTQPGDDITLEVRDKYHNPVPNSNVDRDIIVNISTGQEQVADADGNKTVGEDGRVGFDVTADSGDVNFTLAYKNPPTEYTPLSVSNRSVNTSVAELGAIGDGGDPGGGDGFINGNQSECSTGTSAGSAGGGYSITLEFTNDGTCDPLTLTGFGLAYEDNDNTDLQTLSRDGGNPPSDRSAEVEISATDGGSLSSNDRSGYDIDGLVISLDDNATIKTSETAQINFGYFYFEAKPKQGNAAPEKINKFTLVNSPPNDARYFTVKLKFSDGTQTNVYLKVTDIN